MVAILDDCLLTLEPFLWVMFYQIYKIHQCTANLCALHVSRNHTQSCASLNCCVHFLTNEVDHISQKPFCCYARRMVSQQKPLTKFQENIYLLDPGHKLLQ